MKTSDKINVTDARLRNALKTEIEYSVVPEINKKISDVATNAKIQIATMTKFYPYLDKAEVKIKNKLILCKILHRFNGDLIDFYTPEGEQDYCSKLKEPCIIPRSELTCLILDINDGTSEQIIIGYFSSEELIGLDPAEMGSLKLTKITGTNQYWIKFGGDGLDLRLPSNSTISAGEFDEEMEEINYITQEDVIDKPDLTEVYNQLNTLNDEITNLKNNNVNADDLDIDLNMDTLSNGYLRIEANIIKE